jgi:hypothetical protein
MGGFLAHKFGEANAAQGACLDSVAGCEKKAGNFDGINGINGIYGRGKCRGFLDGINKINGIGNRVA